MFPASNWGSQRGPPVAGLPSVRAGLSSDVSESEPARSSARSASAVPCRCVSRHWNELMEKTGVFFEMTETFTLENMFAMELHRHTDVLNDIVTAAVKEIAIEKVGPHAVSPALGGGAPASPGGGGRPGGLRCAGTRSHVS